MSARPWKGRSAQSVAVGVLFLSSPDAAADATIHAAA
jgi:hypothetical protein